MSVKTFMRMPSTVVTADEALTSAARTWSRDPAACLVVTEGGAVIGAVTAADLRAASPTTLDALAGYEPVSLRECLTVRDAVQGTPIVMSVDSALADVAEAVRRGPQRAAIVTEGGEVIGVLTAADLLGAVVERLERDAAPGLARILVALDLPAPSEAPLRRGPLELGLMIARRHRASLAVLHVMPALSPRVAEGLSAGIDADVHRWRLTDARAALSETVSRAGGFGVRVEVRAGSVVEGLAAAAAAMSADLVVVGGRRGSPLVRAIARRAPCPVLVA